MCRKDIGFLACLSQKSNWKLHGHLPTWRNNSRSLLHLLQSCYFHADVVTFLHGSSRRLLNFSRIHLYTPGAQKSASTDISIQTGLQLQASLVTYLTKHLSTTWSFQVVAQKGLTLSVAGSVSLYAAKVDLNPFKP